jgi:hypothetical protein
MDSVMLARGGEAKAADNIAFFAALASLETSVLLIDHKSWAKGKTGETGAFGSVINHNSIGLSWEISKTGTIVSLHPGKNNDFPAGMLQPIGLAADIESDAHGKPLVASFRHVQPMKHSSETPKQEGEYRDVIYAWLQGHGPSGISAIAKATGIAKSSVSRTLNAGARDIFNRQQDDWIAVDPELWGDLPAPY